MDRVPVSGLPATTTTEETNVIFLTTVHSDCRLTTVVTAELLNMNKTSNDRGFAPQTTVGEGGVRKTCL